MRLLLTTPPAQIHLDGFKSFESSTYLQAITSLAKEIVVRVVVRSVEASFPLPPLLVPLCYHQSQPVPSKDRRCQ